MTFSFKNSALEAQLFQGSLDLFLCVGHIHARRVPLPPEPASTVRLQAPLGAGAPCPRSSCVRTGAAPRTPAAGGEGRPVGPAPRPRACGAPGLRGSSPAPPAVRPGGPRALLGLPLTAIRAGEAGAMGGAGGETGLGAQPAGRVAGLPQAPHLPPVNREGASCEP